MTKAFWLVSITAGLPAALDLSLKLSVVIMMLTAWYYYELGFMPAEEHASDTEFEVLARDEHGLYDPDEVIARAVTSLRTAADAGADSDRRHNDDRRIGAPDTRANPVERRAGNDRRRPQGFGRRAGA